MLVHQFRIYINSFLVFLFFLIYNIFSNDLNFLTNLANAAAVASVILISITLLLGPLSRFFPSYFKHDLIFRKPMGISGFYFWILYFIVIFFNNYNANLFFMFSQANENLLATIFGTVALLILLAIVIITLPRIVKKIGFKKWKSTQRAAYIALVFIVLHFIYFENGYFLKSNLGKTVLILSLTTFAFKLLSLALKKKKKHSKLEITHLTKP
tara:strand:+ start:5605 stop:6240 length:636 start_codon:yes stop_codon:yes gene_type:complete